LELKFIYALKKYVEKHKDTNYTFEEFKENGINTYRLGLPIKDGKITYLIRPQVNLGQKDGVEKDTRTDFYIKCIQVERKGEIIEDVDKLMAYKDVAIYLDGYTYHASKKHMRFYNDLAIRDAISESANIISWSLGWSDVVIFEAENEENRIDELFVNKNQYAKSINMLKSLPAISVLTAGLWETKNSIERLLWYLQHSNSSYKNSEIGLLALSFQENFGGRAYSKINAEKFVAGELNVDTQKPNGNSYLLSDLTQTNSLYKLRITAKLKDFTSLSKLEVCQLDCIDREEWEQFLRLYSITNV
jgi:DEAD/DEAH box helicase domain-containing protein